MLNFLRTIFKLFLDNKTTLWFLWVLLLLLIIFLNWLISNFVMEFAEAVQVLGEVITIRTSSSSFYLKNNSDHLFDNCSFTLYNTHKFAFIPNLFHLHPHSHIQIEIQAKIPIAAIENHHKDFVYLQFGACKKKIIIENLVET